MNKTCAAPDGTTIAYTAAGSGEPALRLPGKVLGVVGIDTFQRLGFHMTPEQARERAEAFRSDYAGSLKQMVKALFHPDADPVESARRLPVPLRAINGDLYPTDVDEVRSTRPEFEVVVMKHMGHYPMLERPEEFDRLVAEAVAGLA